MSDWTAPPFIDALTDAVSARAGITALSAPKVSVIDYWPGPGEDLGDTLILGYGVTDVNDPAALGQNRYEETVSVSCHIRVVRPGAGATVVRAARERARQLLGEVDNQLRTTPPQVGDQTIKTRIRSREMDQFPSTAGGVGVRVCLIDFTVEYTARTSTAS